MDINIDFFACSQSFLVSFSSLFSRVARYAPSKKLKNLLKNHLLTFTKSNDRFGLKKKQDGMITLRQYVFKQVWEGLPR